MLIHPYLNKNILTTFLVLTLTACGNGPTEKKTETGEEPADSQTVTPDNNKAQDNWTAYTEQYYAADSTEESSMRLGITRLDPNRVSYRVTWENPLCAFSAEGEAAIADPDADLETDEYRGEAYPVSEFTDTRDSSILYLRIEAEFGSKARIKLAIESSGEGDADCLPDEGMVLLRQYPE